MKAINLSETWKIAVKELEKPVPKEGEALIRVISAGICGSDIGAFRGTNNLVSYPRIIGHELAGIIEQVPEDNPKGFKVGDKVIVPAITPDWGSLEAQGGYSMHSGGMLAGWKFSNFKDGVFAEYFHVNEADANLARLPEGVDTAAAVMLSDMVPTGFHGAELAKVEYGDSVCVIGIGPVGLMAVAACALKGAGRLFAVGSRPNCVEAAKYYGATDIINYRSGDIVEQILDATKGKGVDKVVVAGGDNDTFIQAVTMLKPGGRIGNVNYLGSGEFIRIPRVEWGCGMGHKTIAGGLMPGGRRRMEKLVSLLEYGRLDTSRLLTHRFKGFEHMEEALMLMKDKPKDLIKPVVVL